MSIVVEDRKLMYPIKEMWKGIADSHGVELRHFDGEFFLPDEQRESFSYLVDLSVHLAFPHGVGIEVARENMSVFEGSNDDLSMAYFGREVKEYSNFTKEFGLIYIGGRRIHVRLNENGNGGIEAYDKLMSQARCELGDDSFGSSYDKHPSGKYGFRQGVENSTLPGVRNFLDSLIEGKIV